jgi:hypothetical protein
VAEADGEAKYGLSAASARVNGPEGAIRSVTAERRRERELTDLGLVVVRWTTDEITHDPARVARRVVAAWQRGDRRAFVGHLRRDGRWLDLPVASRRPSRPAEHRSSAEFGR